jgi:putative ABC transport system ATP-binding protein
MRKKIIEVKNLVKIFQLSNEVQVHALNSVSLDVREGEFISIMGASGSGKSTFMNILGFLDSPTSGTYMLDGIDGGGLDDDQKADIRNKKIGFVFQGFNLLPRTSAIENVEMPLFYKGGFKGSELTEIARKHLGEVGLSGRETHHPNKLSGGEQQRVAIARSLINNPSIILADEPTGNLDSKNTVDIMNLFTRLNRDKGITIVVVTHEDDVSMYTDRRVVFKDGVIIKDTPVKKTVKKKTSKKPSRSSKKNI